MISSYINKDRRLKDLPIHYALSRAEADPEYLVVFMPSAVSYERLATYHDDPVFTRFRWATEFPEGDVISFTDPVIWQHRNLRAAWYIHPHHDVISAIAEIVSAHAESRAIPPHRIVYYGSSLGGFGAIAAAAHTYGAAALAEVPQVKVERWMPSIVRDIEQLVTGMPLSTYNLDHPEQTDLGARIDFAGHVPESVIITNRSDPSYADQLGFVEMLQHTVQDKVRLLTLEHIVGHRPLPKREAIQYISRLLVGVAEVQEK